MVRKDREMERGGGGSLREKELLASACARVLQAVYRSMLVFSAVDLSVRRHFQFRCLFAI